MIGCHDHHANSARPDRGTARIAMAYGVATTVGLVASLAAFQSGVPAIAVASLGVAAASKQIRGRRSEARQARRVGPYLLQGKLGQGAMGEVHRALHPMMDRPVAIKMLAPERKSPEYITRFALEAEMTARLTHPSTVRVLGRGCDSDGTPYYAMECLEGATLADVVAERGAMSASRVIAVLDQVAGALAEAHAMGIVHRDIKPANLFLTEQRADGSGEGEGEGRGDGERDGEARDLVKVLDFGLVKRIGPARGDDGRLPAMTHDESFAGTPLYMAPEAITTPDEVDGRSDLYSLGAVAYFLLTGHDVFTGRTVPEVCGHHLHSVPVPPSRRLGTPVPAALEALILCCLEKDPARRPADATALRTALRACRAE
ncbi:MAG TPA: serine/threonine-protein kinase [Kofleriaceae bacterium]|nr:serine/threonine-protein kinase [Kofleriaceae bacterium]